MVAEILDPIVDLICFCCIFQTVMNLEKRTTRMSSEGPKMGGGRYGSNWSGRKMAKSGDPRWRLPPFAGSIQARLAAAGSEISRQQSSGGGASP